MTSIRQWRIIEEEEKIEIIETAIFTSKIRGILRDDEYRWLQWALVVNPQAGALIPRGNGLRKLRWAASGRGKRGGSRIIYYWYARHDTIYMLYAYNKTTEEDLTDEQMKILTAYVKEGVI